MKIKFKASNLTVLCIALLVLPLLVSACASTPPINSARGSAGELEHGIAALEQVTLGGVKQWILIRGQDTTKPILLYLHGGPGIPAIPFEHALRGLEENFIVVMWDQRGAGKSYSKDIPRESMTLAQFVSDAHELVTLLLARFHREKLYLAGHSCGSIVGVMTVREHPELFYAYIGIGQIANMKDNEKYSYEFVVKKAREANDQTALAELGKITPPYRGKINDLMVQRKWIVKFGGVHYRETSYNKLTNVVMASPEYTLPDLLNIDAGSRFTTECLWNDLLAVDFYTQAPELDVPVYFFTGRHDYLTPFALAEQYFEKLSAPRGKQFIWFENSAHVIILEEPEKFIDLLVHKVLAETYPGIR